MEQIQAKVNPISLSFGLESNSTLWNIVFDGFDQEVVLISRFEGKDPISIEILYKFGEIIKRNYPDCQVEPTDTGLSIKKYFPFNDISLIREWSELMGKVREEIVCLIKESTT